MIQQQQKPKEPKQRLRETSQTALNTDANKRNDVKTAYSNVAKNLVRRQQYDRIEIVAPKGTKARWKALAQGAGKTMAEFVIERVNRAK